MKSKIKILTEDCNFNFEEVFSEKEIYSNEINSLLKNYVKGQLKKAHEVAQKRLENNTYKGKECAQQLSLLHDELIINYINFLSKYLYPLNNPTEAEKISVLATGGYGRGLLAPQSDIDLLFLLPYKKTAWAEAAIENILYFLWDLGLKVGQATRSISESLLLAEKDQTITTSMLDARHLWGNKELSKRFKTSYREKLEKMSSADFIQAKLDEREERQYKAGQSRYLVEPNIKNGKGGLRELEMLSWMTNFCYNCSRPDDMFKRGILNNDEAKTFLKCENFLWHVRCQLHYIAGRPEEVINFNDQREMARRLGYDNRKGLLGVERFMRHYFLIAREVGDLTRSICSLLEEQQKKTIPVISKALALFSEKKVEDFVLIAGRIDIPNKNFFKKDPLNIIKLFYYSMKTGVLIHPNAVRVLRENLGLINKDLRQNENANKIFLEILLSKKNPEETLRQMNETGVLGRFILDFGKSVGLMQFNMYHHYTADEHLLRAIGELNKLFSGKNKNITKLISEIINSGLSKKILTIALLFHDIAKGRDEDHSIAGAKIVKKFSKRFNLSDYELETISWLVREHLIMSFFSQTRDVMDAKTVADFSLKVQTPERLKFLFILTIADITAVGPGVWNAHKGQLLEQLYKETYAKLSGEILDDDRSLRAQNKIKSVFSKADFNKKEKFKDWIKSQSDQYWLGLEDDIIFRQAEMFVKNFNNKPSIMIHNKKGTEATEVSIMSKDSKGLFAKLTGALSSMEINIVNAKIFTNSSNIAIDVIWIQDKENRPIFDDLRLERIKEKILNFINTDIKNGVSPISGLNNRRINAFTVPIVVKIMNNISSNYTVIEVSGKDRPSILYELAKTINHLNLNLFRAQVATFGERVVDVFYVLDSKNKKIEHHNSKKLIERELLRVLSNG
ncbi:MAG: [protein-PII] uridylyltransferase [Pseudomonadota bacterium]|nr:[protein-PII] uridylyltransferase [Pseudomonadota bacterium]